MGYLLVFGYWTGSWVTLPPCLWLLSRLSSELVSGWGYYISLKLWWTILLTKYLLHAHTVWRSFIFSWLQLDIIFTLVTVIINTAQWWWQILYIAFLRAGYMGVILWWHHAAFPSKIILMLCQLSSQHSTVVVDFQKTSQIAFWQDFNSVFSQEVYEQSVAVYYSFTYVSRKNIERFCKERKD